MKIPGRDWKASKPRRSSLNRPHHHQTREGPVHFAPFVRPDTTLFRSKPRGSDGLAQRAYQGPDMPECCADSGGYLFDDLGKVARIGKDTFAWSTDRCSLVVTVHDLACFACATCASGSAHSMICLNEVMSWLWPTLVPPAGKGLCPKSLDFSWLAIAMRSTKEHQRTPVCPTLSSGFS